MSYYNIISNLNPISLSQIEQMQALRKRHKFMDYMLLRQRSFILLQSHKNTPLLNYTYLQSYVSKLPQVINQKINQYKFAKQTIHALSEYGKELQKNNELLLYVRSQQIGPIMLDKTQLINISLLYSKVKQCLQHQITKAFSHKHISPQQLCYLISILNILEYKIWNKVIMYGIQEYKNMNINKIDLFLQCIKSYINKYSYIGIKQMKFKFIMRQTHLNDLIDFGYFLRATRIPNLLSQSQHKSTNNSLSNFDINPQQSQNSHKLQTQINILRNKIFIIGKGSKCMNVNYYSIRQQFQPLIPKIINNIDYINIEDLLTLQHFYVKISVSNQYRIIQSLQNVILSRLLSIDLTNDEYSLYIVKQIMTIWKINSKYNVQIYNQLILPFLQNKIKLSQQQGRLLNFHTWNQIAHSLICCGLGKTDLTEKIMEMLKECIDATKKYQMNKTYRVSSQYMRIMALKEQGQNLKHLLPKMLKKLTIQQQQQVQAIEYNPVQRFWYNVIKNALPDQQIYKSQYISQFQIDMLIHYKNKYFAFQIQGGHYKSDNKQIQFVGKKKVKKQILQLYGITTIALHCEEIIPKLIMRFNKTRDAQKYMIDLLEQNVKKLQEIQKIEQNRDYRRSFQRSFKANMIL